MLTVAVSGINAVDNPAPGTGIARALRESALDVRVVGLAYDALEPGLYMDHVFDKAYMLPYPSAEPDAYLERLQYIHGAERLDAIIPCLDAELPVLTGIESRLADLGVRMLIPTRGMFEMRDKTRLREVGKSIGVSSPRQATCHSREDLVAAVNAVGFPCMVKGVFYEAGRASTLPEAEALFRKYVARWGFPVIVQQFVAGQEYNVVGCGDGEGGGLGLFAIKKMTTTSQGKVWTAVSLHNPRLWEAGERMLEQLRWRGGFELELLVDHEKDDLHLLEINPRFPAWVYMAAACGVNLPERMLRLLAGEDPPRGNDYDSGKLMIRYTAELLRDMSDFETVTAFGETGGGARSPAEEH